MKTFLGEVILFFNKIYTYIEDLAYKIIYPIEQKGYNRNFKEITRETNLKIIT